MLCLPACACACPVPVLCLCLLPVLFGPAPYVLLDQRVPQAQAASEEVLQSYSHRLHSVEVVAELKADGNPLPAIEVGLAADSQRERVGHRSLEAAHTGTAADQADRRRRSEAEVRACRSRNPSRRSPLRTPASELAARQARYAAWTPCSRANQRAASRPLPSTAPAHARQGRAQHLTLRPREVRVRVKG